MTALTHKGRDERDQGFTLIELLVVIIIIGILAAIAIPVFLNQRKKGVDASLKSDLKNAAMVIETYSTDYPTATAFGTGGAGIDDALQPYGLKLSPGNQLFIGGSPALGYCMYAKNQGSTANGLGSSKAFWYDSRTGGLNPTPQSMPTGDGGVCDELGSFTEYLL